MRDNSDPATVFVAGLLGYYGDYRGDDTKTAVVQWLRQRRLSQRRLNELFRWCQENVSTYPPDIAQLRQALRTIASLPQEYDPNSADVKLIEDGVEDRKAELAALLSELRKNLRRRRS